MAGPFIPGRTDIIGPYVNLERARQGQQALDQQQQHLNIQEQQAKSLQDYRNEEAVRGRLTNFIGLMNAGQESAAQQMFNNDPELVKRAGGQIKIDAKQQLIHGQNGFVGRYDKATGQLEVLHDPTKALGPADEIRASAIKAMQDGTLDPNFNTADEQRDYALYGPAGKKSEKTQQMTSEADRIAGSMTNPKTGKTYTGFEDPELPATTRAQILKDVEDRSTRIARAGAVARAEANAEVAPLPASTQKDIAGLNGTLREVDNIRKNFSADFLGPVKGTDIAYKTRRQVGNYINAPLGQQEVTFRNALKDASDQLLRARSGAAINEAEYQRMIEILPKATDEPQVFMAALQRFENQLRALIKDKTELGKTPRGKVGTDKPRKAVTDMTDEELIQELRR